MGARLGDGWSRGRLFASSGFGRCGRGGGRGDVCDHVVCVHACGMRSVRRRGRGAEREKRAGHSIRGCGLGVRYECVEADVLRGLRGFPGGCVQEGACRERREASGGAHRVCAPQAAAALRCAAPPSSSPGRGRSAGSTRSRASGPSSPRTALVTAPRSTSLRTRTSPWCSHPAATPAAAVPEVPEVEMLVPLRLVIEHRGDAKAASEPPSPRMFLLQVPLFAHQPQRPRVPGVLRSGGLPRRPLHRRPSQIRASVCRRLVPRLIRCMHPPVRARGPQPFLPSPDLLPSILCLLLCLLLRGRPSQPHPFRQA